MKDGNYLLDTNIVIGLFNKDYKIIEVLRRIENVFIPAIVIGELLYGAYNSNRKEENVSKIKLFIENIPILYCDEDTADEYGKIKSKLKRKGKPIPENDIWIAAIASQYNLTLITNDYHFKEVDNISIL